MNFEKMEAVLRKQQKIFWNLIKRSDVNIKTCKIIKSFLKLNILKDIDFINRLKNMIIYFDSKQITRGEKLTQKQLKIIQLEKKIKLHNDKLDRINYLNSQAKNFGILSEEVKYFDDLTDEGLSYKKAIKLIKSMRND